jgi:2-succinyl-5-enolpyruvyl-6-hydroxy-3-cyclohexene-1-carboxylate synthase
VCHRLNQLIQGQLFVGNSMPARLMDMLGEVGKGPSRVMTNRGASGIDGLIATAYGFAQSVPPDSREPTTLLLGDPAPCTISTAWRCSAREPPLVVILLNNDGGSIFRMLPVPTQDALLETYYCLPHGLH